MITLESLNLGEILQKAGLNTFLGMGVVFVVLILISLLIYCMRFIPPLIDSLTGKRKKEAAPAEENMRTVPVSPAVVSRTTAAAPSAATAAGEEVDLALIAVITAAIAAQANVPADGIVIRSIRRSAKNNWKRA